MLAVPRGRTAPLPVPKMQITLAEYIARQLVSGTRKKFSSLFSDYQENKQNELQRQRITDNDRNESGR